jgi:hypothetical protein
MEGVWEQRAKQNICDKELMSNRRLEKNYIMRSLLIYILRQVKDDKICGKRNRRGGEWKSVQNFSGDIWRKEASSHVWV